MIRKSICSRLNGCGIVSIGGNIVHQTLAAVKQAAARIGSVFIAGPGLLGLPLFIGQPGWIRMGVTSWNQ
jgi:hypothetical protein